MPREPDRQRHSCRTLTADAARATNSGATHNATDGRKLERGAVPTTHCAAWGAGGGEHQVRGQARCRPAERFRRVNTEHIAHTLVTAAEGGGAAPNKTDRSHDPASAHT